MKRYIYILLALMPLFVLSCQEEFTPGEPDNSDCYGVWFPEQDFSDLIMFDSKDKNTEIKVKISRTRKDGEITVPVRFITGNQHDYMSLNPDSDIEDEIFEVKFEDGQTDAVLQLLFMSDSLGYEAPCKLVVEDPLYAQTYGSNRTSVEFKAAVVDWKKVIVRGDNTASFTNDLMSYLFGTYTITSFDVTLYERTDKPGYYKADGIFSYDALSFMLYGTDAHSGEIKSNRYTDNSSIFIDATDTSRIYIPNQNTGVRLSKMEGSIWIGSNVKENGFSTYDEDGYARISEDKGRYAFPSVRVSFPEIGAEYVNTNGVMTLILPGFEVYNHEIYLSSHEADDAGRLKVDMTLGEHVKRVKYQMFEGSIPEEDVEALADSVHAATSDFFELSTEDLTLDEGEFYYETEAVITRDTTGVYTLVAVTYGNDDEKPGGYSYTTFTYKAKGDNFPVNCTAGISVSDKYKAMGLDSSNSVEYWIQGKNLTSVRIGFFREDTYNRSKASIEKSLAASPPVDRSMLRAINNGGYIDVSTADPGSSYVMVVMASNGYQSNIVIAKGKTTGKAKPEQINWTVWDGYGMSSKKQIFKDWELWALDLTDTLNVRKKLGTVTISDEPNPTTTDTSVDMDLDAIKLTGMLSGADCEAYGLDPVLHWNFATINGYGGAILAGARDYGMVRDTAGYANFASLAYMSAYGYLYPKDYVLMGTFVADGIIAFVDSGMLSQQLGYYDECFGMMLGIYADKNRTELVNTALALGYMVLVDPEKYDTSETAPEMPNIDKAQVARYREIVSGISSPMTLSPSVDYSGPDMGIYNVPVPLDVEGVVPERTYRAVSFGMEVSRKERVPASINRTFEVRR